MLLSKEEVRRLYRRTARFYDAALWMYRLTGADRHRKLAVAALGVRPGDTVVDLGCGTGANLPLLRDAVGSSGRVIGVDLTDAMLERARRRIERAGWENVEVVEADLAAYTMSPGAAGAVATFALEMVPEYDAVIRGVAEALRPEGRLVLYGLKRPERWPRWLVRLGIWLNRPFGVSEEYAALRPWESLRQHLREVEYREFYAGAAYLSVGVAR
jgi:ubiquinone/menaquinone biosynthesis C-methylase UbiE